MSVEEGGRKGAYRAFSELEMDDKKATAPVLYEKVVKTLKQKNSIPKNDHWLIAFSS